MSKKNKILLTGAAGFIGSFLAEKLVKSGENVVVFVRKGASLENLSNVSSKIEVREGDLTVKSDVVGAFRNISFVYHLAARVEGVAYNIKHQADMFSTNVLMGINVLEAAKENKIKKLLMVSSACVYPRFCKIPTPESEGFVDDPEPTNFGYGWSKRVLEVAARTYNMQYGMEVALVRPYNAYGERDHFEDPDAHVIPALIKRVFSGENPFVVWGDGKTTRSFVYAGDLAEGMIRGMKKGNLTPVNLGTNEEISIKDLVKLILKTSGKNPKVLFDTSRPSGQPRRNCDTTLAKKLLGFEAKVRLEEGLKRTIEWYRKKYLV